MFDTKINSKGQHGKNLTHHPLEVCNDHTPKHHFCCKMHSAHIFYILYIFKIYSNHNKKKPKMQKVECTPHKGNARPVPLKSPLVFDQPIPSNKTSLNKRNSNGSTSHEIELL